MNTLDSTLVQTLLQHFLYLFHITSGVIWSQDIKSILSLCKTRMMLLDVDQSSHAADEEFLDTAYQGGGGTFVALDMRVLASPSWS